MQLISPQPVSRPYLIQPATWRDLNAVRRVELEIFPQDAWPLWDIAAVLTFPNTIRLKAVVGEEMVGFVAGEIRRGELLGWITTLGVLPQHRRQGIAGGLLRACEEQMGMPRVRLCVRRGNDGALALYRRHGYRAVNLWERYYNDGEDALVLENMLQKTPD